MRHLEIAKSPPLCISISTYNEEGHEIVQIRFRKKIFPSYPAGNSREFMPFFMGYSDIFHQIPHIIA